MPGKWAGGRIAPLAMVLCGFAGPGAAQQGALAPDHHRWPVPLRMTYGSSATDSGGDASRLSSVIGPVPLAPDSWVPVAASIVLPGAGQLLQGRWRGWLYLGLEAGIWIGYVSERNRGGDDRRAYRDLAWTAARGGTGTRIDGDFEYYERLAYWNRSGAYDADPGSPGLQPEEDPATFNGDAWRLAVSIFLGGGPADPGAPGYAAAMDYYRERAYPNDFLWDWTGRMESLERYRGLIESSDSHYRNASLILGGAVANRIASSLDAVLTRGMGRPARLRLSPALGPGRRLHQRLTLRVAFP